MRRLMIPLAALALVAAACGGRDISVEPADEQDDAFAVQVVEFDRDSGRGLSLAVDGDGNPHLAYLGLEEKTEGAEAEPPVPGEPVLPAVKHAHLTDQGWTRSIVADSTPPEDGTEAVDATSDLTADDEVAIALGGDGTHHVAWISGGTLFHATNQGGEFSEPAEVEAGELSGASIAVDGDGAPWVAFYDAAAAEDGEGPAGLVRVATLEGDAWTVDTAAEASAADPASTAIGITGDGPAVAYGNEGTTQLARRTGGAWESETADEEGGLGVSMALDADGNPHLAYMNAEGQVRHSHSVGGRAWETSEVAPDADLTAPTSIAVDSEGVHHVAWALGDGIAYATNAEGSFAPVDLRAGAGGAQPKVAAGGDGIVHLAWYDTTTTALKLATAGGDDPLLAYPSPEAGGEAPTDPNAPPACQPEGTELTIAAQSSQFDKDCLAAPAGQPFTIAFDNQDASIPHNVSIYTEEGGESLFLGETITGTQTTYNVDALEAGNLYFQCDVHPTTMQGDFAVA